MKRVGVISDYHNTDGSPRRSGVNDKLCWGSGYRVTLAGDAVMVDATTTILERCPNSECTVRDLTVVNVIEVAEPETNA